MNLFARVLARSAVSGFDDAMPARPKGQWPASQNDDLLPRADNDEQASIDEDPVPLRRTARPASASPALPDAPADNEDLVRSVLPQSQDGDANEQDVQAMRSAAYDPVVAPALARNVTSDTAAQHGTEDSTDDDAGLDRAAYSDALSRRIMRGPLHGPARDADDEAHVAPLRRWPSNSNALADERPHAPAGGFPLEQQPDLRAIRRDVGTGMVPADTSAGPAFAGGVPDFAPDNLPLREGGVPPAPLPRPEFNRSAAPEARPQVTIDHVEVVIREPAVRSGSPHADFSALSRALRARYLGS